MGSKPRGISASRGAAVLGLSPYQSIFEVWQRICEERRPGFSASRGYALPEEPDNAAIRWGTAFESSVIDLAEARMGGCKIIDREAFWSVNGFGGEAFFERASGDRESGHIPDYITCHIDGRYSDFSEDDPSGTLHEGKTTSMMNFWDSWGEPGTDRVPQGYQVQAQQQMLCTGAGECVVSVLVFPRRPEEWEAEGWVVKSSRWESDGPEGPINRWLEKEGIRPVVCSSWARVIAEMGLFHQYPVAASPTLQRTMVDAYSHFWHTYVLPECEPDITTYKDIRRAFIAPKGTIVASEQEERWAAEYKQIGEEIGDSGRLGKRRDELKVLLLGRMRAMDSQMDDESREATVLRDRQGKKIASWNGKVFRS